MKIDPYIRRVMEAAQVRRREAAERVKAGEIPHLNFMGADECYDRAVANLGQLKQKTGDAGIMALADVVNYGLAVIQKTWQQAEE